jgi:protein-S-isoprenylcysteine O-methyltransferase Ste14
MLTAERATNWAWAIWAVSWWAAAAWRKPAVGRASFGAELLHLSITLMGFALLFATPAAVHWGLNEAALGDPWRFRLWRASKDASWVLFAAVVCGFGFCWWARIHLGALWSGSVTRKADHQVIDTGPYAWVRHPIYTGLILATVATAGLRGTLFAATGAALVVIGLWIKSRLEERFLREELGAQAYDGYAARTPMLIPRPWPSTAKS